MLLRFRFVIILSTLLFCGVVQTQAAVVVNAFEDSGNVVFDANGSLDLDGLTFVGNTAGFAGSLICANGCGAVSGIFATGPTGTQYPDRYSGITGVSPTFFGSSSVIFANFGSGDFFGVTGNSAYNVLLLPPNYVSGASISSMATFENATFASLGLVSGSYTYSLPNDTITLNIAPTPLPAALPLFLTALAGMGLFRWWKHRLAV